MQIISNRATMFIILALLLALTAVGTTGGVVQGAGFTVDSTADTVDASPGNGVCDDGSGNCTLRAAIQEANALPGPDTIPYLLAPTSFPFPVLLKMLVLPETWTSPTI